MPGALEEKQAFFHEITMYKVDTEYTSQSTESTRLLKQKDQTLGPSLISQL